jgi:hypothetical protein
MAAYCLLAATAVVMGTRNEVLQRKLDSWETG